MRRRDFITGIAGSAAAWPLAARSQQPDRMRLVGVLMSYAENDSEAQAWVAAFRDGLQKLGWTEGRNIRFDTRWAAGPTRRRCNGSRRNSSHCSPTLFFRKSPPPPRRCCNRHAPSPSFSRWLPIQSPAVSSLSRPGGHVTGFATLEGSLGGKWLELLKEIAPRVTRAAVLWDPAIAAGIGQFAIIQSVAPSFGVELSPLYVRDTSGIERAVSAFARSSNGGLIVTASTIFHRDLIVALAARHKLPAVYSNRDFVTMGGLISYGADFTDQFRRAAVYVDRILKGEKPADLPVQAPTKYELAINLPTARMLGLEVPPTLLARADEVIE